MPYNKIKIFVSLLLLNERASILIVIKSYGINISLASPTGSIIYQKNGIWVVFITKQFLWYENNFTGSV